MPSLHPAFAVIEDKESAALVFEWQGEANLAGPLRMELAAERRIAVGERATQLAARGDIAAKHRQAALSVDRFDNQSPCLSVRRWVLPRQQAQRQTQAHHHGAPP